MVSLYSVLIRTEFAAAHQLRDYPGECSRLHGHNWKLDIEVVASELDAIGMVVDFKKVKAAAKQIADKLDHQHLNEIPPFNHTNPTAENIAAYFFHALSDALSDERVKVSKVSVWETDRACATYTEV